MPVQSKRLGKERRAGSLGNEGKKRRNDDKSLKECLLSLVGSWGKAWRRGDSPV